MSSRFRLLIITAIVLSAALFLSVRKDEDLAEFETASSVEPAPLIESAESASAPTSDTASAQSSEDFEETCDRLSPDMIVCETEDGNFRLELTITFPDQAQGPRLLSRVPAEFPLEAVQQDVTDGFVILDFTVTSEGLVEDIVVRVSDGAVFEGSAIAAVSGYIYEPAYENGVPVDTTGVSARVSFNVAGPRVVPYVESEPPLLIAATDEQIAAGEFQPPPLPEGPQMLVISPAPEFPAAATSAGLNRGYVILSYSITARGTTTDIAVIESSSELFEMAATEAVQRYIYKPRVEQGQPVRRENVKRRIDFSSP